MTDLYEDGLEALDETITSDSILVLVLTLDREGFVRIAATASPECEDGVSEVLASAVSIVAAEEATQH